MIKRKLQYWYRYLFYHWQAKYLCRLGMHKHPDTDMNIVTSYVCVWCGHCVQNTEVVERQRMEEDLRTMEAIKKQIENNPDIL